MDPKNIGDLTPYLTYDYYNVQYVRRMGKWVTVQKFPKMGSEKTTCPVHLSHTLWYEDWECSQALLYLSASLVLFIINLLYYSTAFYCCWCYGYPRTPRRQHSDNCYLPLLSLLDFLPSVYQVEALPILANDGGGGGGGGATVKVRGPLYFFLSHALYRRVTPQIKECMFLS